ncbi:MAG: hypothetical protein HY694_12375 [Deltaproteobacteria bacterium]|nr:hypothetical protein [Deltaproteobacteria bacterium]
MNGTRHGISVERMGSADPLWNARLQSVPEGSWYQSANYGEYKRKFRSEEPVYLVAKNGRHEVAGQLLAFFTHPYEWGFHRRELTFCNPLGMKLIPSFYWLHGPTVFEQGNYEEVCRALISWMAEAGRERGCVRGRATPAVYTESLPSDNAKLDETFTQCGFSISLMATMIVDLRPDLDVLFGNLKREARTKIRKARNQGVKIVEVGNDKKGLDMLCQVMRETALRNELPPLSLKNLRQSSWSLFYDQGFSRGFVSTYGGNLVSSQMAVIFNRTIILGGVSYTDYGRDQRIYGNDLMQWHLIEWGKENNFRLLDLAGVAPKSTSPKMQGICNFKSKWGGIEIPFCEYTIEYPSWRGYLYRTLTKAFGTRVKKLDRKLRRGKKVDVEDSEVREVAS